MTALAALAYECEAEGWQRGAWGHWVRWLFQKYGEWDSVKEWMRGG